MKSMLIAPLVIVLLTGCDGQMSELDVNPGGAQDFDLVREAHPPLDRVGSEQFGAVVAAQLKTGGTFVHCHAQVVAGGGSWQ